MRPRPIPVLPEQTPSRRRASVVWVSLLAWALAGCASLDQERHLAPLLTELSTAGGERELEALGGALLVRRRMEDSAVTYWAVRPLASHARGSPERSESSILPPLGSVVLTPRESIYQLLPLVRYSRQYYPDAPDTWTFFGLPGFYWSKTNDGRIVRAFVPIGGVVEHFLSYDRMVFVLMPLFIRYERNGRETTHFLFPFFSWSRPVESEDSLDPTRAEDGGGSDWRVWPFVGVNRWEGRYERWFFLWPFFHWQSNDLDRPDGEQDKRWMVWPLFGGQKRGATKSWMALWPFFGYTANSQNGFWAWDGPWPLVTIQRAGETGQASRTRVWPFYSHFDGDGMTSTHVLWPIYNKRREVYGEVIKDTTLVLPFYQAWDKRSPEGPSRWLKVFPFFSRYDSEVDDESSFAFPSPSPFTWRLAFVEEHYAWMWELYSQRRKGERLRERSWLGLWRREKGEGEDRRSLVGLWARRDYMDEGVATREQSVLFGLLRWRSSPAGVTLLQPAFPGPGWPLERVGEAEH